ncbi:hypothetical protein C8F04DRAFT_1088628 [Mycena alexandri]|uniref:Uncharacterized protein n=1 Tax=Mycena alexandri TaxID=1745969 RepID=A0AAD6T3U6_9AGAR|nr:hypothetical protein C8F04DRAFT_1088628 [Mycena alexandri]
MWSPHVLYFPPLLPLIVLLICSCIWTGEMETRTQRMTMTIRRNERRNGRGRMGWTTTNSGQMTSTSARRSLI